MTEGAGRGKVMTLAEITAQCVEVGDCLEWQGMMAGAGSGRRRSQPIYKRWNGRYNDSVSICREVWTIKRGPIPPGKIVYRTCCNDRCLKCLAVGDPGAAHRLRKKLGLAAHTPAARAAITSGSRARSTAKYSIEIARNVRALAAEGLKNAEIVARTGLPLHAVSDMKTRSWQDTSHASSVFVWRPAADAGNMKDMTRG